MPDYLISGAGIAGLTTAIALQQHSAVRIVEQATGLSAAGAGIQLSPNATQCLDQLGLLQALEPYTFAPEAAVTYDGLNGQTLFTVPLQTWSTPYWHIHRADLQQVLLQQLETDKVTLVMGQTLPEASISAESSQPVIIAEGIRSDTRRQLLGSHAISVGHVAWRSLIPVTPALRKHIPPVASLWLGPKAHVVHYYVAGGQYLNVIIVLHATSLDSSWDQAVDVDHVRQQFADWHHKVRDLIAQASAFSQWSLAYVPVLSQWYQHNAVFIGDAAHAIVPYLAQGGALAIEDAVILGQCLAKNSHYTSAYQQFQQQRFQRVRYVQQRSLQQGKLYHLRNRIARSIRNHSMQAIHQMKPDYWRQSLNAVYESSVDVEPHC